MIQEQFLIGRIILLQIFKVPEFGTRASFRLECTNRRYVTCAVADDVAREFVTYYREGDIVAVTDTYAPRPSTASSETPWAGRFRVRTLWRTSGLPHKRGTPRIGTVKWQRSIEPSLWGWHQREILRVDGNSSEAVQ